MLFFSGARPNGINFITGERREHDVNNVFKNTDLDYYIDVLKTVGFERVISEQKQSDPDNPFTFFNLVKAYKPA